MTERPVTKVRDNDDAATRRLARSLLEDEMTCTECGEIVTAGLLVPGGYLLRPCLHVAGVDVG